MAETLPVIFRTYRGEVSAYFPTVTWSPGTIACYAHVGQHGGACRTWLHKGRPATPEQRAPLLAELQAIYAPEWTLRVYQRDPSRALARKTP